MRTRMWLTLLVHSSTFEEIQLKINSAVLLTVHISIFIPVINQLDAQNFCFTVSYISCLYMFRAHVLIIRRSKLHYTASGIVTPIGGRLVQVLFHAFTCFEHMCYIIRRSKLHYTASGIVTPIGGRLVHRLREYSYCKTKFCASSWLITEINMKVKGHTKR